MSPIEAAARPRMAASPAVVVETVTHRLTPRRGAPRSTPAGSESVTAAKCSSVTEPATSAVASVKASTAPQKGESITVAPRYGAGCPSNPPNTHMSVPTFTTNPVAPWFVPAFTRWVIEPMVMLPACAAVGAVHALTVPQASSGAARRAAGAAGVGAGGDAAAGAATLPHAPRRTAKQARIARIRQGWSRPLDGSSGAREPRLDFATDRG